MNNAYRPKILLIDDDVQFGQLIRKWLPESAYELLCVSSAKEGLIQIHTTQRKPNLILLDLLMPEMDGYEFCRQLKESPAAADIKIIFVTGLNDDQNRSKALLMGAAGYLTKPFTKESLQTAVEAAAAKTVPETAPRPIKDEKEQHNALEFGPFKKYLRSLPLFKDHASDDIEKMKPLDFCDAKDHLGLIPEQRAQLISNFSGIEFLPYIDPEQIELGLLSPSFCIKNVTVPIRKKNGRLYLVTANPFSLEMFDLLCRTPIWNEPFTLAVASARTILYLFGNQGLNQDFGPAIDIALRPSSENTPGDHFSQHTVAATYNILASAVTQRASDIHVEPKKNHFDIRFRIDGEMKDIYSIEKELGLQLITRLKALAGMDISERRKPQDGAAEFQIQKQPMKFRFATTATPFGESIIIRLLDPNLRPKKLEELGMTPIQAEQMMRFANRDRGFVLMVGPTGSGKTTTIYSLISMIDCKSKSVMTIEDPVEYWIPYANQQQVNEKAGLTFDSVLKSCVRQDPDILFLGEMRDAFSAKTSFDFTSTGHLTVATMHTSNATTAFFRLERLGVSRAAMADTILGVVAQRLLKTVCSDCAALEEPTPDEIKMLRAFTSNIPQKVAHPKGCIRCNQTGYHGRTAVYEIIEVDPEIAKLIRSGASVFEMRQMLKNRGGYLMFDHTLDQIRRFKTSPAEAYQKVFVEEIPDAKMEQKEIKPEDPVPLVPVSISAAAETSDEKVPAPPPAARLLIIEDDADMAKLMIHTLENRGFEICAARDAVEAFLQIGRISFDLILSDISMPHMDGLKFMEILRQKGVQVPVIFITADATPETEEKCLQAGAADYIRKPFDKKILTLRIQKHLRFIKV